MKTVNRTSEDYYKTNDRYITNLSQIEKKNLIKQILGFILFLVVITSCNKDDKTIIPIKKEKYNVEYIVNSNKSSPIFNLNITYNDKEGKEKSVLVTEFPWKMSFEIEAPFTAKFKGIYTVKTGATIPKMVIIDEYASLKILQGKSIKKFSDFKKKFTMHKTNFNKYIKTNTIDFGFSYEIK